MSTSAKNRSKGKKRIAVDCCSVWLFCDSFFFFSLRRAAAIVRVWEGKWCCVRCFPCILAHHKRNISPLICFCRVTFWCWTAMNSSLFVFLTFFCFTSAYTLFVCNYHSLSLVLFTFNQFFSLSRIPISSLFLFRSITLPTPFFTSYLFVWTSIKPVRICGLMQKSSYFFHLYFLFFGVGYLLLTFVICLSIYSNIFNTGRGSTRLVSAW